VSEQSADMFEDDCPAVVTISHEAGPGRHQREIGDGSSHKELEERLGTTDVTGLANAELHPPRQPVFGDLTQLAIRCERASLRWKALASWSKASCGWIMTSRPFPRRARIHEDRNGQASQMSASKRHARKGRPGRRSDRLN
jgi:hypothetical protein